MCTSEITLSARAFKLCQQAPVDAEMFVRLFDDRYRAVHFRGSTCTSDHEIAEESVEHRRQKGYWQRQLKPPDTR